MIATDRPFAQWGAPASAGVLPKHARAWLESRLGELHPRPRRDPTTFHVPPSRLTTGAAADLAKIVGVDHLRTDRIARLRHSAGSSYLDLLRQREGLDLHPPDAVATPGSESEILAILQACARLGVGVVPSGGGTSVVGGVEPRGERPTIVLSLARLTRLLHVDQVSRTATVEPGLTGPRTEELLEPYGLTVGHVPQSYERATLGGYAATRSAGQTSTGFGRFDDLVVALRLATPQGVLALGTGTPNAAGPDLRSLVIGSEGTLGVLTQLTVRVRLRPEVRRYEGWMLPTFDAGIDLLRGLVQDGDAPDITRLSDPTETEVQLALRGRSLTTQALDAYLRMRRRAEGCLLIVGWEGTTQAVRARRRHAVRRLRSAGGVSLGHAAGDAWRRHRFEAPYQRDALLDAGVLVETLETATTWSRLPAVYGAVREALSTSLSDHGAAPIVMTHLSHLYPTGSSLYVTVLAPRVPGEPAAAIEQWRRAKNATSDAIVTAGGTITHHHAVGRDHAPWLRAEVGDLGLAALRSLKSTLDPANVLNPGVLLV